MSYYRAADGRDLSKEEWRVIPSFPSYEITSDGDVRNIRTWELLNEVEYRGRYIYNLSRKNDKGQWQGHKRGFQGLIWDAFPELKPKREPKPEPGRKAGEEKRSYIRYGEWRELPGYHKIEVHETGAVRRHGRRFKFERDENGNEFVNLTSNTYGFVKWLIPNLVAYVFPEKGLSFIPDHSDSSNWKTIPEYDQYEVNRKGEVRHKVRKQILSKDKWGRYGMKISGQKFYWSKDRFFTDEAWVEFWNGTLDNFEREAA
jgi:hypothetical protein